MKLELLTCFLLTLGLSWAFPRDDLTEAAVTEDANNSIEDSATDVPPTSTKASKEDATVEVSSTTTQRSNRTEEGTTTAKADTTRPPTRRYPCSCSEGECGCCTGAILQNFNLSLRQRGCVNVTYDPDDFAFNMKLLFNDRVLYQNKMSAKNPRPVCVPINRYFGIKMCLKASNVFISQRNLHACVELEGQWQGESAFKFPFDCFRIGSNGLAVVKPEDGGGLPPPPDVESEEEEEDYDDSARGWIGSVEVMKA